MTKQKTISSLSIAAIALLAAAIPALAQGQTESSGKTTSIATTFAVEQTIASNRESSAARKSRLVIPQIEPAAGKVARNNQSLVLSALKGQNNFTSAAKNSEQLNFKDTAPIDPLAKKQFRADETEINRTRQVAFVPSRGQKLPE